MIIEVGNYHQFKDDCIIKILKLTENNTCYAKIINLNELKIRDKIGWKSTLDDYNETTNWISFNINFITNNTKILKGYNTKLYKVLNKGD